MSSVVIAGDTSGSITLQAPAVAGTNIVTLPAATGELSMLGGAGQTWQVVTGSRASATTYYNTTGKPIMVYAGTLSGSLTTVIVGGVTRSCVNALDITFIVPPEMSYSITLTTVSIWTELR